MSVDGGAEGSSGTSGSGDVVNAMSNRESGVRVAPVGRCYPLRLLSHRLAVEHDRPGVRSLGYNRHLVGEFLSKLHIHASTDHYFITNVTIVLAYLPWLLN